MNYCLVTGATGFIGRELCRRLSRQNIFVKAVTRQKIDGCWDRSCFVDFAHGIIPGHELDDIDTVFHLAGIAHDLRTGSDITALYSRVNTAATVQLASLAAAHGVKRFVFVSSVKAGASPAEGVCAAEDTRGEPDGIYGRTKRDAETELLRIGEKTGMHVSVIRPALVYGANLKGNLRLMLNGIVKGWFPPLPETANIRTMVHVDDLVRAIILAAEKEEANGEIFIVSDGEYYSSREIYDEMCVAAGHKIPSWSVPGNVFFVLAKLGDLVGQLTRVPFDSYRYTKLLGDDCYSSAKIREKLGFQPRRTLKDALPEIVSNLTRITF